MNWPTREERDFFEREGYLIVPNALSPTQVASLVAAIDRCGSSNEEDGPRAYNRLDILSLDDAFVDLVDNSAVLGKIAGFLGWNIWVNHTHYNVRPPDAPDVPYRYNWHPDGGVFNKDLQFAAPMTAIKVGFYLTDLRQAERGQTYIVPLSCADGRNLLDELGMFTPPPPEAVPLMVEAGTAVLFQQRTFHSHGSPNRSDTVRKTVFIQWAYRWLASVDSCTMGDLRTRVADPLRKQMLGLDPERSAGKLSSRYYPHPTDIPLKKKLIREVGIMRLCELGPATTRELTQNLNFDAQTDVTQPREHQQQQNGISHHGKRK